MCLKENTQVTSLGLYNTHLQINGTGSPFLEYLSGSDCSNTNTKYSTKIEFICSEKTIDPIIVEKDKCKIVVQVQTEYACLKQETQCSLTDNTNNNKLYDLGPLKNNNKNYRAIINKNLTEYLKEDSQFFINVCRPLVPEYGMSCTGGTASCYGIKHDNTTISHELSLGYFDASLGLTLNTNNTVIPRLIYLRGDDCPTVKNEQLSTIIDFYCNPKSGLGVPELVEIIDSCQYRFVWDTNVFCASHECLYNEKNCEIFNEQTNATFNLKSIGKTGVVEVSNKSLVLQFKFK